MTDNKQTPEAVIQHLNEPRRPDIEFENNEEDDIHLFCDDEASDETPNAMLTYLEVSRSRAEECESLILKDFEVNILQDLPPDGNDDTVKVKKQVFRMTYNGSNFNTTDSDLLTSAPEREEHLAYNVSVYLNNKAEVEKEEYLGNQRCLELDDLEKEEEEKRCAEHWAEQEKQQQEQREEQRRGWERDFEEELKRIEREEMLHQKDFELMEKSVQEELQQELLQQQELMSSLQRGLEVERRAFEEAREHLRCTAATTIQAGFRGLVGRRWWRDELGRRREERREEEQMRRLREMEERKEEEQMRRLREMEERRKEERRQEERRGEVEAMEGARRRAEYESAKEEERGRLERERRRLEEEEGRRWREEEREMKERKEREKLEEDERRKREEEEQRRRRKEYERQKQEERERREEEERKKQEKERREQEERKKWERERREQEERKKQERREEEERKEQEERERREQEERRKQERREEEERMEQERREEEERKEQEERERREEDERRKQEERERREQEERKKQERERREQEERKKWERERREQEERKKQERREEEERKEQEERERREQEERRKQERREEEERMEQERREEEERKEQEERERREEDERRKQEERERREQEERKEQEEERRKVLEKRQREEKERKIREQEESENYENEDRRKQGEKKRPPECQESINKGEKQSGESDKGTDVDNKTSSDWTILPKPSPRSGVANQERNVLALSPGPSFTPDARVCLQEFPEQKRLSWMRDCTPWSQLSLHNRRATAAPTPGRRRMRRADRDGCLPPLCPDALLHLGAWRSLQEVSTVALDDLPGCSLSTLAQCVRLQSLTLRRCGLRALEGLAACRELRYVDLQENDITFVDCENLVKLRVLRLSHNKLTSLHGLGSAVGLDCLEVSYNSISRIAGLESMQRLQRLLVDHNQLISTRGLQEVCTLLHLDCSHNHLTRVEGLDKCALLGTLDLRANSLTEPPRLSDHVLLRELRMDNNSIFSLQSLAHCWLPLLQHLSTAHNSITQLPSLSDCISLVSLDLGHNCLSELENVCESLLGCPLLKEVHFPGNPLEQEADWRFALQNAAPGLRLINGLETDASLSPPAVLCPTTSAGSLLAFCQAQLQQSQDLQEQHSRVLSAAPSSLDALEALCLHYSEHLRLAGNQRYAHEHGNTSASDSCEVIADPDTRGLSDAQPEISASRNRDSLMVPPFGAFESSAAEGLSEIPKDVPSDPGSELTLSSARTSLERRRAAIPRQLRARPVNVSEKLALENTAVAVIQQSWRRHREKCRALSSPPIIRARGGGRAPPVNSSVLSPEKAATVIQALWRGYILRKRLSAALASAAAACPQAGEEEEEFQEVDVDEFVYDEKLMERDWTLNLFEESTPKSPPAISDRLFNAKPPGFVLEPDLDRSPLPLHPRSDIAWESSKPPALGVTTESTTGMKSASAAVLSGLSESSEKILEEWGFKDSHTALLMLKRAQKMKSKKHQQRNRLDAVGEARLDLHIAGSAEQWRCASQERTRQWLYNQASYSHRLSGSDRFLPDIDPDVVNGGPVQLVAVSGYRQGPDQDDALCASSTATRLGKEQPLRNSWGHARRPVPSPPLVSSAPSKKERISFRDNPAQMSGGWGGGKKRDKVCK